MFLMVNTINMLVVIIILVWSTLMNWVSWSVHNNINIFTHWHRCTSPTGLHTMTCAGFILVIIYSSLGGNYCSSCLFKQNNVEYNKNNFESWLIVEAALAVRVVRPTIHLSAFQVLVQPLAGFVSWLSEFKSLVTLIRRKLTNWLLSVNLGF